MRRLIGLLVAPIPAMGGVTTIDAIFYDTAPTVENLLIGAGWIYGSAVLFGIPIAALLDRRGEGRARSYMIAAALILAVPVGLIQIAMIASGDESTLVDEDVLFLLLAAGMGALVGLSYWLIARPDQKLTAVPRRVARVFE